MKHTLLVLLILFTISVTYAQTWTTSVSGTIDISTVINITLSNQAATPSFTTAASYQGGITTLNYTTVAIKSNVDWIISLKAQSTYFTPQTAGASSNMPAGVLGFRLNGNPAFTTMSTTSQTLKLGNNGSAAATGNTFKIDMFFNPGFTYAGGLYSIGLLYTVSEQ